MGEYEIAITVESELDRESAEAALNAILLKEMDSGVIRYLGMPAGDKAAAEETRRRKLEKAEYFRRLRAIENIFQGGGMDGETFLSELYKLHKEYKRMKAEAQDDCQKKHI